MQDTDIGTPPAADTADCSGRILVIMNPASGKKKAGERAVRLVEEVARDKRLELREVEGRGLADAVRQGLEEGYRTFAAAGGDGTICGVASALMGSGCRMGVIPLGTFNYFARGHGLPEDIGEAVRVLCEGATKPLDIGEVNGVAFLNNASLGAYSLILQSRERIYARWGRSRLAAYWSVLVALSRFRIRLSVTLTIDGETHRMKTPMIFVANNPYQLELFNLEGAELIREGNLVAMIAPDVGRLGLIAFAARLAMGTPRAGRDYRLLAGRDILVETKRRRAVVARDGERQRLAAPFRFRLRQAALELIVPPV
ncbi:MAG TPA: diacylglycerol kinase family protein [Paracoccaceae bacterium]|nr:diacylglycerol kinase family protein [Paracoccaceae bacterium]